MSSTQDRVRRVRHLNDAFRKTFAGGRMMMSASVAALPDMVKSAAWLKVSEFNKWDAGNDPHHEHDFFSFELCNRTFFWKCDYYNNEMDGGSEDPSDPSRTVRVGLLMLVDEY
ncbi:hypothetical protein UNPF46_30675 [Bradyrhizobium sp. UNPF46]|uniref:DUF3768 domain-containing protein n=1 Tax=Bradyrhizobium sp. UNPF46 TaxID=1141168 RepID=UPI00114DB976|nr:DUF3768 domain-containing protein [Bradyrhizobium sp. UNPF46]TQF27431.1 hypothetical protein UNPF46_30675 [Bradyrhizobium sp. UNPF46]